MSLRPHPLGFLIGLFATFYSVMASAEEPNSSGRCFEVIEAMNYALQGMPKDQTTAISLFDREETRYMLFVALSEPDGSPGPNTSAEWRLLERQAESLTYCLSGAGKRLELLASMDDITGFGSEFGLPGTSKRRCSDESDGPLGTLAVRSWASKELGPSLVQRFGSAFAGSEFTVLIADVGVQGKFPWIILQEDSSQSCYFARGDDSRFSGNFSLKAELVQDPSTLTPLE